jgi:hypothetical protein
MSSRPTLPGRVPVRRGRWFVRALPIAFAAGTALFASSPATAQVHWDASAQVGVMKRFLHDRPPGSSVSGDFGPTGQLTGHVALLPLIHVGGYFGHDISHLSASTSSAPNATRNITFGGVRVKGMIPFVRNPFRLWVFAGFGYAGVYSQSFSTTFAVPDGLGATQLRPGRVEGAGGSFFEVPFGVGASYRLFKPWELSAELGARTGFGHTGSVYEGNGPQVTVPRPGDPGGSSSENAAPAGLDRFAIGLTVGVMIDL